MNIISAKKEDAKTLATIISHSNLDVAEKFGLNFENNPKHPSFYNEEWALADFERGEEYFIYQLDGKDIACVAFEQPNEKLGYLNRLAVLPEYRNKGIGEALTKHIFQHGKSKGIEEISIGVIAKHTTLKNWYAKLGFIENGLKEFPHLPFDVLFMKYEIDVN